MSNTTTARIVIGSEGIEIGDWNGEPANEVLARFAEFVSARTGIDDVEIGGFATVCTGTDVAPSDVDVTMWEEFCAAGASAEAFEAEFRRVFGSCNVAFGAVFADGWPEPVRYDFGKGAEVLVRFDDGHGATEKGDAEVCAALEAAGAVLA